ncbi:DinB family protein [Hymenobacter sp. PAMC 26628]|uniref:DinB family protein n=1 Tax=Hymenobacter sp. PAMC 26628 TaxID=1484118 RepID=UPI00076FE35B|nr:DinB family protein [Hymenobacter sp. PAMC 26628]AMJ66926.1 hypothetical protein AXW84_16935 [Hymenobacter sp. PAMC 26628]
MPALPRATSDFFDDLTNALLVLRVQAQRRFRLLGPEVLNRRPGPGPGPWSVGECLEHLNIVGGYFLPTIGARLRRAQERGSQPAPIVKHGLIGARLVASLRIPAAEKPRVTPQRYAPTGTRLTRTVTEVYSRQLDELLSIVLRARQVNANAVRIPNPLFPLLRLRLVDQLEYLVVHLQRHAAQAERVLAALPVVASE